MQVTGSTITVTGLSYAQTHTVTVTAAICPGIETSSVPIPFSFNIAGTMVTLQTTCSQLVLRDNAGACVGTLDVGVVT